MPSQFPAQTATLRLDVDPSPPAPGGCSPTQCSPTSCILSRNRGDPDGSGRLALAFVNIDGCHLRHIDSAVAWRTQAGSNLAAQCSPEFLDGSDLPGTESTSSAHVMARGAGRSGVWKTAMLSPPIPRYREGEIHVLVAVICSVLTVDAAIKPKTRRIGVRLAISNRPGEARTRHGGGYDALRQLSDLRRARQDPVEPDRGPYQVQAVRPEFPGLAADDQGGPRQPGDGLDRPIGGRRGRGDRGRGSGCVHVGLAHRDGGRPQGRDRPRRPGRRDAGGDALIVGDGRPDAGCDR